MFDFVRRFMTLGGQRTSSVPNAAASREERVLGAKLILEEAAEVCKELGIDVKFDNINIIINDIGVVNLPRLAKELADLKYVATWNQILYGIPECTEIQVCENNLAKFEEGWTKNEYGKVIPPKGWVKLVECDLYP